MSWLQRLLPPRIKRDGSPKKTVPEGLWTKCDACSAVLYRAEVTRNLEVCPKCNHHMRMFGRTRLEAFLDTEGREEIAPNLEPVDMLKFKDQKKYKDRIVQSQRDTGEKDVLIAMRGTVKNVPLDPEDGELIPSIEYECLWRHLTRDGKVIETKEELRSVGKVFKYNEQDSGHVLVKVKHKGWFALADGKPALRQLARWLVLN